MSDYIKIAQLKSVDALRDRLGELGLDLPVDDEILTVQNGSPLAEPFTVANRSIGNRWCIHPMEGWDANLDGSPSEFTLRRWRRFGESGAKLIWGGEAAAVQHNGRANPRQTLATPDNRLGIKQLLDTLLSAHRNNFGSDDDLLVGLQLTHSGRFSRPNSAKHEPRIAYRHPLLDEKFHVDPNDQAIVWTDDDLELLIDSFVQAAGFAQAAGYHFVDVKACHGYLLHEFLSARSRTGKFGGDFDGRTRLLLTIIDRIRGEFPGLLVGVRLSLFDFPPYQTLCDVGKPMEFKHLLPYSFGFGTDPQEPLKYDLREPLELLRRLQKHNVFMVNLSCGSPYYNPHIQRPAIFPPSDGYQPPEDPLVGVARQIHSVREVNAAIPDLPIVGSGFSYLQDYLPHVAQAVVRDGWMDFVGLGRMVLSYPELPRDVLEKGTLARKQVCRTFSDCTTAPRHHLISGCYPLDPFYKQLPEAEQIRTIKQQLKADDIQ